MLRGITRGIAVSVLGGLALAVLAQTPSPSDWRSAPTRTKAYLIADLRFQATKDLINARRRQTDQKWNTDSQGCNDRRSQKAVEDCKKMAADQYRADMEQTDKDEAEAKKAQAHDYEQIAHYWDRRTDDPDHRSRIDGRDGQRYVDKLPKPAIEFIYPAKQIKGYWKV